MDERTYGRRFQGKVGVITGVLLDVDAGDHVSSGSWSPMGSPGDKIDSMGGPR